MSLEEKTEESQVKENSPKFKLIVYPRAEFLDSFEYMEAKMNGYSLSDDNGTL